jgi:hypothetical protein
VNGVRASLIGASLAVGACAALLELDDTRYPKPPDVAPRDVDAGDGGPVDAACDGNFSSDPRNCGSCGHDCFGGACADGACRPFVLASVNLPEGLALAGDAGDRVVWSELDDGDSGAWIRTCRLDECDGGTGTNLINRRAWDLAADGDQIYWENFSGFESIQTCALPSCATGGTRTVCQGYPPSRLRLTVSDVIWTYDTGGSIMLRSCARNDAGPSRVLAAPLVDVASYTFHEGKIFFAVANVITSCDPATCDGGAGTPLQSANGAAHGLTSADGRIFWLEPATQSIRERAIDAGPVHAWARVDPFSLMNVAAEGTHLFWTSSDPARDAGGLYTCEMVAAGPRACQEFSNGTPLTVSPVFPARFLLTSRLLVWTDKIHHAVMALSR